MTLFEFLSVAVSIVLGLAAARLLDALPHVLASGRRYWVHATITCVCLWNLGNYWWALWSFRDVQDWTALKFFLILLIAGLHYSIAVLLTSPNAQEILSWRDYFSGIRARMFSLALAWILLISVQNSVLLAVPWGHPTRVVEAAGIGLFALGAVSTNPRVHGFIAVAMALSAVIIGALLFLRPAPLL